ncbi:hypothetical protein BWI96_11825 [Siphonobacter sp. SORGH_AS_0500]|uniref:DUF3037 domain-containing protein n=1 Tax=Siphonobacter sp. SORGH_AS_0500 TaxID=1864824 RepID=UPI000CB41356|nr:DUF3037 domain-containing protein [Siphonobacter sp. SORGH_AS_0500]PKK36536.1 hypothetical protein BWI96_11825 [Siphonobacter sp. SORGH_AS_0500]
MKPSPFTYSLLQYNHSAVSGEILNVGILFIFPEHRKIIFRRLSKLTRLRNAYKSSFQEQLVKGYLKTFESKAREVSNKWNLFSEHIFKDSPDTFISKQFLNVDASSLQFSRTKVGITYNSDISSIANDYFNLYFGDWEEEESITVRDEDYIVRKYKNSFINVSYKNYIKEEPKTIATDLTSIKIDISWQNGVEHLVKPLSFDLASNHSINDKAVLYNAKLNHLSEVAHKNRQHFDILVTKPSNINLLDEYEKSVDLLKKNDGIVTVVEEDELETYTQKTIREVSDHIPIRKS